MADSLNPGSYKIISLTEGNPPLGVGYQRTALQVVRANQPVQDWVFRRVGKNKYLLSIDGYRHTGVLDGKVIASIHPEHEEEWEITHQVHLNAYTIALAKKPHLGWTIPIGLSDGQGVEIQPLIATGSIPPHFLPRQLFTFVKDD